RNLRKNFAWPVGIGLSTGALLALAGIRQLAALVSFSLCAFVATTIATEFIRGARVRQGLLGESASAALARLGSKNHRRYGGYVIHLGVVLIFLGITGSSLFKEEIQATIAKEQSFEIGGYTLRFAGLSEIDDPHVAVTRAELEVSQGGKVVGMLR